MEWSLANRLQGTFCVAVALSALAPSAANAVEYGPTNAIADLTTSMTRFKELEKSVLPTALGDQMTAANARGYIQAGVTMSNIACDTWLTALGRSERDTGFFKNVLNIVGNLILGISGINGASSDALARGALFLGASNAAIDAYKSDFLMGVISEIKPKVREAREIGERTILADVPTSYHEAQRRLLEYHDLCSPEAIQRLLKTSLSFARYAPPDTTLASETNEARSQVLADQIYRALYAAGELGPGVLSDEDLFRLWTVVIAYPSDTTSDLIKSFNANPVTLDLKTRFNAKKDTALAHTLNQIAQYRGYAKRLQVALAEERATKESAELRTSEVKRNNALIDLRKKADALDAEARRVGGAATAAAKPLIDEAVVVQDAARAGRALPQRIQRTLPDSLRAQATELEKSLDAAALAEDDLARARQRDAYAQAALEYARRTNGAGGSQTRSITPVLVPVNR